MDPKQELVGKYLELCATFRDGPEVAAELERLRSQSAATGAEQLSCFLDGRIALVREDYAAALESFQAALALDPDFVLAVHMQAVCLGNLGRHEEALAACDRAVAGFGDAEEPALRAQLAKVLVNRGATLGELGRHEDSIAVCRQVVARFGDAEDLALREQVAKAMINQGVSLGELGRRQEEVAVYDEVIARFGDAADLCLQEQVAWAMVNRGIALGELDRGDDEIAAYDEVVLRFGHAEDPSLREAVAEATFNKGVALGEPRPGTGGPEAGTEPDETECIERQAPQSAPSSTEEFVELIHGAPGRVVLVLSGGGSRAIAELLEVPGASRTLLEAVVPYSEEALIAWLGGRPENFCSSQTARAMAMAAFRRAWKYEAGGSSAAGVACAASLASDRPKRGAHRAHLALQTASLTATWSLELLKGRRSRAEEERLVCRLLINTLAAACGIERQLQLDLLEGEQIDTLQTVAPQEWQDLLLGKVETVCHRRTPTRTLLPGAFNPLHVGHRRMAQLAAETLGVPVAMELSILNVDKPPLDYHEIQRRLGQFAEDQPICLTRAPTFDEKSRLFPGATFIVGVDTLRRIADPRYYGELPSAGHGDVAPGGSAACLAAIERIADRGCRFLVFGRDAGTGFMRLSDLDLPEPLRQICREVPADAFREDVSSTALRKSGAW